MTKDDRIVVRMSAELRAWVHEQAQLGEQDDAAFVRMVLSNARRGVTSTVVAAPAPAPAAIAAPQPVRDVLDVTSAPVAEAPIDVAPVERATIDVDAMIGEALEDAEAQGLTEPAAIDDGEPPPAGVRSLFRRPTPFSPGGNQLARIEQYLASNS